MSPALYSRHVPGPPLSEYVDLLWCYEGYDPPHEMERVLPDGTMEVIFNLQDDEIRVYGRDDPSSFERFPGVVVSGAHSCFNLIDTSCQSSTVGVHFKPGGASPFLGPASELCDLHAPLDALWGRGANSLRERLVEAETPGTRFRVLEGALLSRLEDFDRSGVRLHPAVALALRRFGEGPVAVAEARRESGLSHRRFVEVFRREVGMTPKLFLRVRRFQRALATVSARPRWAELALESGYFDQSHLIHDFHDFAGLTPASYLSRRTDHENHVPLEAG